MKKRTPWMIMIAGPNGAGKSTFYDLVIKKDPLMKNAPFVNLDNMIKETFNPKKDQLTNLYNAGVMTCKIAQDCIENQQSFSYETISAGNTHLHFMDAARKKGFKIATIFIGLSNHLLSYLRVQQRVLNGGHNIPYADIVRCYPQILKKFPQILKRSDVVAIFNNSGKKPFDLTFLMDDKSFRFFYQYPKWLKESICEKDLNKGIILKYNSSSVHQLSDEQLLKISQEALKTITQEEDVFEKHSPSEPSLESLSKENAFINQWLKDIKNKEL